MSREETPPPYKEVLVLWAKMQLGVIFAFVVVFIGSFVLAPEWTIGKRIGMSMFLPIMLEILASIVSAVFAVRIWRVHRLATNREQEGER